MRGQDYGEYVNIPRTGYWVCQGCMTTFDRAELYYHKCEKGQSPKGSPAPVSPNERSNVRKQPRMPRKQYSTRFKTLTRKLSATYFLMAGLNLITFCISIPFAIGDPLALVLSVWAVCGMTLSIWAGLWVRGE
jgi:hypothetical protein